jgi:RNA-binding protein YlmH
MRRSGSGLCIYVSVYVCLSALLYCYFVHQHHRRRGSNRVFILSFSFSLASLIRQNTRAHTYIRNKKDMSSSTAFSSRATATKLVPSTSNRRTRVATREAFFVAAQQQQQQKSKSSNAGKKKADKYDFPGSMPAAFQKDVTRALEQAKRAEKVWSCEITDFYSPPLCDWIEKAVRKNFGDRIVCDRTGGYAGAEQQRMLLARPENSEELFELAKKDEFFANEEDGEEEVDTSNCAIACVNISGKFAFDPATHPDFLGAVLNAGVKREKIGDILVNSSSEGGAKVLATPAIAVFLTRALESVRTVKVTVELFPLSELEGTQGAQAQEPMRTYEASLRLDAVASAGFRCARTKMGEDIAKGNVKLNYNVCEKKNATVGEGDMISCRGRGRVEVKEILEQQNDRYRIELVRYK